MRLRTLTTSNLLAGLLLLAASRASAHSAELAKPLPELPEYFALGVEHILLGFDHLVFLLGVVLIATRTRSVLLAVTAFTLAHSLTLGLSVMGAVSVSPRLVEPLIALSVAYVGLENFWRRDGAQRYRLTFAFGLVHGFGFAGALSEIGVPEGRAAAALALFNLGVEGGQLLVLAVVWPLLVWLRRSRERPFVLTARVVNVVLVVLGVGWALERTLGGEPAVATDAAAPAAPAMARAVEEPSGSSGSRTVYPAAEPLPLASRVCRALQRLPRERRAACGGGPLGVTLEGECTRMLSAAVQSGALQLSALEADLCVAAIEARYEGCDFMRATHLPPLAACEGLWKGQSAVGAQCRSSLECQAGLHCHGVGPSQAGVCGEPKAAGAACGRAIDPLAAYVPERAEDHPECAGTCGGQRCL
jgi:hydrogenase/urease accessory protein HupE